MAPKFINTIIRRVIFSALREGQIKRADSTGLSGETILDREVFQHYGFTSSPLPGAEGILFGMGNVLYYIAEDDRRYRIEISNGEVALYTDEGDKVHLKRGRIIEVVAGTKVMITSPDMEISGDLKVSGDVSDATGSMASMRSQYNSHTHPGGGAPSPQMT